MTFEQLGLSPKTLRALAEMNFTIPTPIQEQAIPKLLEADIDLLGLAQTGTGKTAAFSLPILEKIDGNNRKPQALILCPTRELCMQITKDIEKFSSMTPEIRTVAVYGGASISMQIRDLRRGVQIIVATPGRMIDIIERGEVNFEQVKIVVLDEAVSALDVSVRAQVLNLLREIQSSRGLTYLFITHDLGVAHYMADEIAVMFRGRIVERGNRDDVFKQSRHHYTTGLLSSVPLATPTTAKRISEQVQSLPSPVESDACNYRSRCAVGSGREDCKSVPIQITQGSSTHSWLCHSPVVRS